MVSLRPLSLLVSLIIVSLCTGSVSALEITPITGRLAIGSTGILCVTEPCPWRGVVELDNNERDPLRPLWSGEQLPTLRASPEDAARIEAAWDRRECLEIEGEFYTDAADISGAPIIRVHHVVGTCS